jgi:hypothetical protein
LTGVSPNVKYVPDKERNTRGDKMKLTYHANKRSRQRGFQEGDIELIMNFGTPIKQPGNAVEFQMRRENIKHIVQALDRISRKAVLINQEKVITVYNLEKR